VRGPDENGEPRSKGKGCSRRCSRKRTAKVHGPSEMGKKKHTVSVEMGHRLHKTQNRSLILKKKGRPRDWYRRLYSKPRIGFRRQKTKSTHLSRGLGGGESGMTFNGGGGRGEHHREGRGEKGSLVENENSRC